MDVSALCYGLKVVVLLGVGIIYIRKRINQKVITMKYAFFLLCLVMGWHVMAVLSGVAIVLSWFMVSVPYEDNTKPSMLSPGRYAINGSEDNLL